MSAGTDVRVTAATAASSLAILFATACGGSTVSQDEANTTTATPTTTTLETTTEAPRAPEATEPTITIEGSKYSDATVPPGAQVTVVNQDSGKHSVTSDAAGAFDVDVDGKQTATFTAPTEPGSYPFYCTYHPRMRGVLTVQ